MRILLALFLLMQFNVNAHQNLQIGMASTDITPPIGTPLGGYGGIKRRAKLLIDFFNRQPYTTFFKPSVGILDPIRAKSMVLKNDRRQMVIISIDAVGVTIDVYRDLRKRLKAYGFDDVIITATHTHSGPGALSKSWVWAVMAMDRYHHGIYQEFTAGIVDSAVKALDNLVPAKLTTMEYDVPGIQRNRADRPGYFDQTARMLLAKDMNGNYLGGIVNYAIHPTAYGSRNLFFSADLAGAVERGIEKVLMQNQIGMAQPTMLFINGGLGDISVKYGGTEGIKKAAAIFTEKFSENIDNQREVEGIWSKKVIKTKLKRARFSLKKCGVTKRWDIRIPLGKKALPRDAYLWAIQLGEITMMTWPGEPTAEIGFLGQDLAKRYGFNNPWVISVANGHMGYFQTKEEYDIGGYEACVAFHGGKAGRMLLEAYEKLFSAKEFSLKTLN